MKKLHYIFILTCLFLTFEGKAQEEISLTPKDTVKVVIDPNRPARAAFYSALVPGLGQVYNKKYWKRVYLYFGNDLEAWCNDVSKFNDEYMDSISSISKFPQYFDTVDTDYWKFTDKFLEEVMTW